MLIRPFKIHPHLDPRWLSMVPCSDEKDSLTDPKAAARVSLQAARSAAAVLVSGYHRHLLEAT